jgi:hypothetical protein
MFQKFVIKRLLALISIVISISLTANFALLTPANALVIPQGSFPPCLQTTDKYCVVSITITSAQGNSLNLQYSTTGAAPVVTTPTVNNETATETATDTNTETNTQASTPPIASVAIGRSLPGQWSAPGFSALTTSNPGITGVYLDAKAANQFSNDLILDLVPTTVNGNGSIVQANDPNNSNYAIGLDPSWTITETIRTDGFNTGISVGVGLNQSIINKVINGNSEVTVSGNPVSVPVAKSTDDCNDESGIAAANINQFQAVIFPQSDTSGFGVDGISGNMLVTSNGVCELSSPTWDSVNEKLTWTAAAPHFAANGTDLNQGFYRATIPFSDAKLLWGLTDPAQAASALQLNITTDSSGSSAATSSIFVKKNVIYIDATGFNFSKHHFTISKKAIKKLVQKLSHKTTKKSKK